MADEALTRILYVEDDADIRSVAGFALEAVGGFVLAACASGEEALAQAPGFAPQLLLLDVMMPGMDGPETLAALRALPDTAATPAVFMTAKVQPQEVARFRALGAIDVISKPFDPMTLSDEIRDIWTRRQGLP
ncbi:MAG: response regulator [Inquilinus sp.]|uniref:response regulator n=1 Tax=Inquilinus sp. TaxID=1932117 RepID=UPI003F3681D4